MWQAAVAKIGLPVLVNVVAERLRRLNHPAAKAASEALEEVDIRIGRGDISPEELAEANRHDEQMATIALEKDRAALAEVNESLRTEARSEDAYVRRMRPTFGYIMALTWAAQMGGLAYVIVFRTEEASLLLEAVESLSLIWTVGLSVLGIYVYKRSEDKKNLR